MTDSLRVDAARKSLLHYRRLLDSNIDEGARAVIEELITEAEAELGVAEAEEQSAAVQDARGLTRRARQWRMKAEEFRATAELTKNDLARRTYLRLAEDYDCLAEGAETKEAQERERGSKAR